MKMQSHHFARSHRGIRRRGFSLAECAFSLLLTAVVIVAALKAAASTQRTRLAAQSQRRATELALRLMAEIRQNYYIDPGSSPTFGPESGEFNFINRANYNDVDDYRNIIDALPLTPKDKDGTTVPGSSGYWRNCSIDWIDPNNPTATVSSDQGLKRITVSVTGPDGNTTTIVGLRSSKGLGEQPVSTTTTFVTWAGAAVTVGSNSPVTTGVSLINRPQ